jgi:hypothetical protein
LGTVVELTHHPFADGTLHKLAALKNRTARDPHPFVTGRANVERWLEQMRVCTREVLSRKRAAAQKSRPREPPAAAAQPGTRR